MKFNSVESRGDRIAAAVYILLAFSFVFGGASHLNSLRLALVELAALPLLIVTMPLIAADARQLWREHSFFLIVLGSILLLPLIQLMPLPLSMVTGLGGRDDVKLALEVTEISPTTGVISLTPDLTREALLALIPPTVMAAAFLITRARVVAGAMAVILAISTVSIVMGGAQLLSGSRALYPWPSTDAGSMAGLFANRNHLATLCLVTLPFSLIFAANGIWDKRLGRYGGDSGLLWVLLSYASLVVVALAAIMSRAGIMLAGPVMILSLLAAWIASGRARPTPLVLGVAGTVGAALASIIALAVGPILARFSTDGVEGRFQIWPEVADAAQAYLPLGSGIGSFNAVYRSIEPLERLGPLYYNHAHNEYLEVWLETGWLGVGVILAFLVWFGRRTWAAWQAPMGRMSDLQRASSIAIMVVLLHSVGDYPMRTETIAVVFALCCAILEFAKAPREHRPQSVGAAASFCNST